MKKTKIEFNSQEKFISRNYKEKALIKAFSKLKNEKEIGNFLRDLLTLPEIEEFANRLEIAKLLLEGKSYLKIANVTGVSTTTVTRVAHWLFNGCGGYDVVLRR